MTITLRGLDSPTTNIGMLCRHYRMYRLRQWSGDDYCPLHRWVIKVRTIACTIYLEIVLNVYEITLKVSCYVAYFNGNMFVVETPTISSSATGNVQRCVHNQDSEFKIIHSVAGIDTFPQT